MGGELTAMTSQEFKACVEKRGWNPITLAVRWRLKKRRLFQVMSYEEGKRPLYYDDAVRGLPILKRGQSPVELVPMTPGEVRYAVESKGWSVETLAIRWALSIRRIQQILADQADKRPLYYDDAIRNLPVCKKKNDSGS